MTLVKPGKNDRDGVAPGGKIRFARPEDADAVVWLARASFTMSRFHLDPDISDALAAEVKARWAGNFFTGQRGDAMVVCDTDQGLGGFLQLITTPERLIIDLVAVAEHARRQGRAGDMIAFARRKLPRPETRVGTQVANIASLRLYDKLGFRAVDAKYVFHFHSESDR